MKNVIVYNQVQTTYHTSEKYTDEHLINYLKAQVDNSLRLGWNKEDIIIGTNFDFEHKGIINHKLKDVCTYSGFNNFWYGALELMNNGVLEDNFWLHDQDTWPIRKFDFPNFDGEIAGCEYIVTKQWNCGSVYFKKTSKFILEYIVELMRNNPNHKVSSDEEWIAFLRHSNHSEIKDYLKSLNTQYNVGVTHFNDRYNSANKPINVLAFKPDLERDYNTMKHLIDTELMNIFKKNKLSCNLNEIGEC
jgi:hypothetical protein